MCENSLRSWLSIHIQASGFRLLHLSAEMPTVNQAKLIKVNDRQLHANTEIQQ